MARDRSDKRKRAGGAADRRRAQTYLAQLAWLEELDVDPSGDAIAKARRAARTVMREHGKALPSLVGDVDRWWAIVDAKLAWWSTGRTAELDLTPLLPPRLSRASAAAGDAGRRAAIAWVARPALLEQVLGWLTARHDALAMVPVDALQLARLVVDGERGKAQTIRERGVDALIALLAVNAPDPIAALDLTRSLESRLLGQTPKPAAAPKRSRPRVVAWLEKLRARDTATRQRSLALLAEARVAEALGAWAAWERDHAPMIARATELAANQFDKWDKAVHATAVIKKLEAARDAAPTAVSITDVLVEIDMLACDTFAHTVPAIARFLAALPPTQPPAAHARMLLHCARAAACASEDEHVEWVWDAVADALENGAPPMLLDPWLPVWSSDGRIWLEDDLVEDIARADVARVVAVMAALARAGRLDGDDARRVAVWWAAGLRDEALLAEVVIGLRDIDERYEVDVARAILALALLALTDDAKESDRVAAIERVGRLVFAAVEDRRYPAVRRLVALIERAVRAGGGWIVRGMLESGQGMQLERIAELLPYAKSHTPPMVRSADAAWIARYPAALAPSLRRLASVDPDAEATAAKRLAADLPDPAALEREIAVLRERVGGDEHRAGLAKRLANLEARLASPKPPSAKRLANLADKLDRAACETGLARFRAALETTAITRVVRGFGIVDEPPWLREPRTLVVLFALLELGEIDRALAGRLLRARCGEPPWDLRDDPANRAFLDRMRRARIDPAPWLDDRAYVVQAGDNKPVTLALCSDPLEVFEMGAHFQTCLSPDGGNFFSVIANAADINKRVLYARRDGKVVGRCLLALTDGFTLLTFHPYCHDGAIAFHEVVRDFAVDLATRMNTSVAPRGSVRTLLARDWYDDGSRDLVGRFRGLEEAGLDLAAIAPSALVGVLRAALEREIDDVTLPLVLGHQGVRARPELIFPLAPFVLASAAPLVRVTAAHLALEAGDRALADRMLGEHAGSVRLEHHVGPDGELLAQLRPSYALARLRETRAAGVRTWRDDRCDRIAMAGIALETLHRPKQAAAMYRLAMRDDYLKPAMRRRLRELGEPVDADPDGTIEDG